MREFLFQMEPAQQIAQEIGPLLEENWKTVEASYPRSKLAPNIGFYVQLQDNGVLRLFTSREEDVLVGYAVVYLYPHPHRADDLVGTLETFFIRGNARSSGHATRFLTHIENELRMLGATSLTLGSRNERYDRWLRMRGYHATERIWERSLQWSH